MRARNMSRRVSGLAGFGRGEVEAAIDDKHAAGRGGEAFDEVGRGNKRGVVRVRHDSSRGERAAWWADGRRVAVVKLQV